MRFRFRATAFTRHGTKQGMTLFEVVTVGEDRAFAMACSMLDDEENASFTELKVTEDTTEIRLTLIGAD